MASSRSANKTAETDKSVDAFLATIEDPGKRSDATALLEMMTRLSGEPARMWGEAIVGFGNYHYKYESGREGDFFRVGFSPRKAKMTLYLVPGFEAHDDLLAKLGKHSTGKSCLYVKRLSDLDLPTLERLISASLAAMELRYPK